jgi:hypothetical protein
MRNFNRASGVTAKLTTHSRKIFWGEHIAIVEDLQIAQLMDHQLAGDYLQVWYCSKVLNTKLSHRSGQGRQELQ